jgi:hypothetical protein
MRPASGSAADPLRLPRPWEGAAAAAKTFTPAPTAMTRRGQQARRDPRPRMRTGHAPWNSSNSTASTTARPSTPRQERPIGHLACAPEPVRRASLCSGWARGGRPCP